MGVDHLGPRRRQQRREIRPGPGVRALHGGAGVVQLDAGAELPEPGRGPLPAIAAALRSLGAPALFVVAGDMPHLSTAAVALTVAAALARDVALAPPWVGGGPEPLHAGYRPTCLPAMARALDAGRLSVQGFFPEVRVARVDEAALQRIDPTLACLRGVNVPADLT